MPVARRSLKYVFVLRHIVPSLVVGSRRTFVTKHDTIQRAANQAAALAPRISVILRQSLWPQLHICQRNQLSQSAGCVGRVRQAQRNASNFTYGPQSLVAFKLLHAERLHKTSQRFDISAISDPAPQRLASLINGIDSIRHSCQFNILRMSALGRGWQSTESVIFKVLIVK